PHAGDLHHRLRRSRRPRRRRRPGPAEALRRKRADRAHPACAAPSRPGHLMNTPSDSLRFWLREATRPLHEAVDQVYAGYVLREREGYRSFLRAHAAALSPIEAWLQA